MASSMIHLTVANELNKKLNKDKYQFLIGSIASDISKLIGEDKSRSHFLIQGSDSIPDLDKFLKKYKYFLNDDFILGYYVHLYTDYLWFKYFISEIYDENNNMIYKLNGETVECHGRMAEMYIYNDYTNLNSELIDKYDLELKIFYQPLPEIRNLMDEIPMDKLNLIVDKTGSIIDNIKTEKSYVFDMASVDNFISECVTLIEANLNELGII